ncbi:MAG: FAD-dependent oxidoreductase [Planctomycetota bacterium]
MRVAILGAGVTGLSAAYLLLKRGVPVTVYEASEREGGLAGSFTSHGFTFDFGPHEFCTTNPALTSLLAEVCGEDLLVIEKRTAQYFNGTYLRYPFEFADVLKNVDPLLCLRAMAEVAYARVRNVVRPPLEDSFEAWTRSRFGPTLYRLYFGPYTQKVWGIDPRSIDPRTATSRITVDSAWDLIKKSIGYHFLGSEDLQNVHSEYRRTFYYVRDGIGALQAHLRRRIEELGGRFEFGRKLVQVSRRGDSIVSLGFENGRTASGFTNVVSTVPLPNLVRIVLGERGNALVLENDLPFRGMVFVFLRVNKPQVLDNHWTYYPDLDIPFQRTTEFVHFEARMTPPGRTGLTLEVASNPGDGVWELHDADIAEKCVRRMCELQLLRREDVDGFDVVRVRNAYPVQVMHYQERADALVDALGEVDNLVTIGRQGLFRYCNMNECVEMSIDVVGKLALNPFRVRYTSPSSWMGVDITERMTA